MIRELSWKFEAGGGGDHDSQPVGRGTDDIQVKGGLGGEGVIEQLSLSTIYFSTIPKLSRFTKRENIKNNIVDNNNISAASTFSNVLNILTNERSQSRVSSDRNVWTNQRTAGVERKRKAEDSGEQRNRKYPKFNSYFDQ